MTRLHEPIINSLLALLRTQLPAKLDSISAEIGDGVPLEHPAAYFYGGRGQVPEYPAVFVDMDVSNISEFGESWGVYTHTLQVEVRLRSDNEEAISLQVTRYARALWEIMFSNQNDPNSLGVGQAISMMPKQGRQITNPQDPLTLGYRWTVDIEKEEIV